MLLVSYDLIRGCVKQNSPLLRNLIMIFIIDITLLNIDFKSNRDPISATHILCNFMNIQEVFLNARCHDCKEKNERNSFITPDIILHNSLHTW